MMELLMESIFFSFAEYNEFQIDFAKTTHFKCDAKTWC